MRRSAADAATAQTTARLVRLEGLRRDGGHPLPTDSGVHRAVAGRAGLGRRPVTRFRSGEHRRLLLRRRQQGSARAGRGAPRPLPVAPRRPGHLRRARGAPGARRRRQGQHDPARDERREPAGGRRPRLPEAVGRGARPRLPLALRAEAARPRPDRDLQPLALRGGARRPGPSADPRGPEAPARGARRERVGAALPADQRLGTLPRRERVPGREAVPQPLEGGAAPALPQADRLSRRRTGSSTRTTSRSGSTGTSTRPPSRRCCPRRARRRRPGT